MVAPTEPADAVLFTMVGLAPAPTLLLAAGALGLPLSALDSAFGVLPIDPVGQKYCVRVFADRVPQGFSAPVPHSGPFAAAQIDLLSPLRR